jgi:uracil-DNA glycosylase
VHLKNATAKEPNKLRSQKSRAVITVGTTVTETAMNSQTNQTKALEITREWRERGGVTNSVLIHCKGASDTSQAFGSWGGV